MQKADELVFLILDDSTASVSDLHNFPDGRCEMRCEVFSEVFIFLIICSVWKVGGHLYKK